MVLHNPNNWHWVNKDVKPWAKDYLERELVKISAQENDAFVKIKKVVSVDGDVDVSQRKGKVITIFDLRLQLEFNGETSGLKDIGGLITIPEVAHDTDEHEYVFEIEIYSDSEQKQPVKRVVLNKIVPRLRQDLQKLSPTLIAEHGKDIQHAPNQKPISEAIKLKQTAKAASQTKSSSDTWVQGVKSNSPKGIIVNVTRLTDQEEFRTTADQLFKTFTDPQMIAAFTHALPKVYEGAKEGGRFEIFDGNVQGEYLALSQPTKIIQRWRLAQWPEGHSSTLKIEFHQNDLDGVTVMRVDWDGVPIGQEEVTKRNWREYYVRSIKRTFGYGTLL